MSSSLLLKNIYCLQPTFDGPQYHGADLLIVGNKVEAPPPPLVRLIVPSMWSSRAW